MENKKNCPYCGKEINEDAKFCKHCGKSLIETSSDNKKTQIVNTASQAENINEPKPVPVQIVTKSKKPKKITMVLLVVAVICIAIIGVFQILRLTSPNIAVKVAKTRVINDFKKDIDKYNSKTSIYNMLKNNNYDKQQKEINLAYDKIDFEGDKLTKTLLNKYLKNLSINILSQDDEDKNLRYDNISVKNEKNTILEANIYSSEQNVAISLPQFYNKIIGTNLKKYSDKNSDASKFLYSYGNMISSRNVVNECIIEQSINLYSDLFNICNFKKEGRKNYVSSIENEDLIEITSDYLKELFKNKDFKQYAINSLVTSQKCTFDEAKEKVDKFEKNIDAGVKKIFKEAGISDVQMSVTVDSAKIKNINLSSNVKIDGEKTKLSINADINSTKEEKEINATISLKELDLLVDYSISNDSSKGNQSLKLSLQENKNELMSILVNDKILDDDSLEGTIDLLINNDTQSSKPDNIKINITAKGKAKSKEKVDLSDINCKLKVEGVEATLGLKGSIVNEKASKVKKVDNDKITFLEDLDDEEVNDILNEILNKIQLPTNSLTNL